VVDEFGSFVGVVTLEDLVEEIVGELTDEHDPDDPSYRPTGHDGVWVMAGDTHVDEVERALGLDMPPGDRETIAGLVIEVLGSLPEVGETVTLDLEPTAAQAALDPDARGRRVLIEVLAVERHVPARVRVSLADGDPS
jgi:CBS domain containing-hemolysin-like protein